MTFRIPEDFDVRQRMLALAVIDAALMTEWEYRYFSFNAKWTEGEQMGSIRTGEGDELFYLSAPYGEFFMGNAHEYPAQPSVFDDLPEAFFPARDEPAFSGEYANLCCWRAAGATWQGHADAGRDELLRMAFATPERHTEWANEYYERDIPLKAIASLMAGEPLTKQLVRQLNDDSDVLETIREEVLEMGWAIE